MKKIISAKEHWMNDMNDLRNEGYECDACCEELGAIGENEFYSVYGNAKDLYFSKVGETYTKIDVTDVSEEYLLATNWQKLNPEDEWYDHKAVWKFLVDNANGKDIQSPIEMCDLIWMGIFPANNGMITQYEDKEIEVSNEEIETIRKKIVERCKGHSIEVVREMFDGYNCDEYGLGSFDLEYEGFVFSIQNKDYENADDDWYLSCVVCDACGNECDIFDTTTLEITKENDKRPADDTPIVPQPTEKVKEKPKYDGAFLAHVASIFNEGHRVILVYVSGVKYVLNGLFDNKDVIIDCYEADTMKRVDRYFVIGAQDKDWNEAAAYAEHFMSKIVKERLYLDTWFLTDKQFEFLKNA